MEIGLDMTSLLLHLFCSIHASLSDSPVGGCKATVFFKRYNISILILFSKINDILAETSFRYNTNMIIECSIISTTSQ